MTDLVADTHALVWHLCQPRRLGRAAARALQGADEGRHRCLVPVIALVEVALLHERGRLAVGVDHVLEALAGHPGYEVLPLDAAQVRQFAALVGVRDPLDRLVLSAALATDSRLLSADPVLDGHGVVRVWD